ncbi:MULTISPECIES: hypothetical protein [unclassified Mesorhizobium]
MATLGFVHDQLLDSRDGKMAFEAQPDNRREFVNGDRYHPGVMV